ncbi:MAG: hypothetical protein MRERV_30c005 [Mycoplasmataceae bacterium RV_VA103A]|nr:MAG: hypothetical protein MRERV_30c005 [Mycoplasmataceae bacterium RV_VA103A]
MKIEGREINNTISIFKFKSFLSPTVINTVPIINQTKQIKAHFFKSLPFIYKIYK